MGYGMLYAKDAFHRVRDFLDEKVPEAQGFKSTDGRKQLDEVIVALDEYATEQKTLDLQMDGYRNDQTRLEKELSQEHLQAIADFARGKLRGMPNYATLVQPVSDMVGKTLVLHARAVAAAAGAYLEDFTRGGFPQETITQLTSLTDQLENAIDERANLKVRRAGSTKAVTEQTARGHDAVKMLNGMIKKQYAKNQPFLASWRVARRVVLKPGFPRGGKPDAATTAPVAPVVTTTPAVTPTPAVTASTTAPVQGGKAA